ncbi:MAG: hypothetical protein R3Y57_03605 [Erysipelotrichaceae bacterium]
MLLINQLKVVLTPESKDINPLLKGLIIKKLKIKETDLIHFQIVKESLDARKNPTYIYSVCVEVKNEKKYLHYHDVSLYHPKIYTYLKPNSPKTAIVVGFGPSGLFTSYLLAKSGIKTIVFERGKKVEDRQVDVQKFWNQGILNSESNVQFGEGGAGTFSDGKLTTRIKDDRIQLILDILIEMGCDPCIAYQAHPHIGSDVLYDVIRNFRNKLIQMGVEFHFETKVESLLIVQNKVVGVQTKQKSYTSDAVVLAIGHSAKDTLKSLANQQVYLETKDFAVGVRVEHPQSIIDSNQYKAYVNHPLLQASEYRLAYNTNKNYGVYSFCMCPGGQIVASSADQHTICTNGMSLSQRSSPYANSAILVQVKSENYHRGNLFDGEAYQRALEEKAYQISNSYHAPACNIKDYLNHQLNPLKFTSSYLPGTHLYDLNQLFDPFINEALHEAFLYFDSKIKGFIEQGIMLAPETRSSAIVRMKRNEAFESISHENLYPCGEGAGYAGGIVSSALDGIKVAEAIIKK